MAKVKRFNRRELIGGLVGGLVVSPLLSACAGAPEPTPTPAPKPAAPAPAQPGAKPAESSPPTAAKPAAAGDRKKLAYWTWSYYWTPAVTKQPDPYLALFEGKYPGWTYEVTLFPYPDFLNALKVAYAGGDRPDAHGIQVNALARTFVSQFEPLQEPMKQAYGPDWIKRFPKKVVDDVQSLDPKGGNWFYGPERTNLGGFIWYHKGLFEKFSIKQPVNYTLSYADLVQAAKTLKANGIQGVAWPAKDKWMNTDLYLAMVSQIADPGPETWPFRKAEEGKIKFTDQVLVEALKMLRSMIDDGVFIDNPQAVGNAQSSPMWNEGKAGMTYGFWHQKHGLIQTPGALQDWRVFQIPAVKTDATWLAAGPKPSSPYFDVMYSRVVPKGGKNKDAAINMAVVASSDEAQKIVGERVPPAIVNGVYKPTGEKEIDDAMDFIGTLMDKSFPREMLKVEIREALQDAVEAQLLKTLTPQQGMEKVQAAWDACCKS
ncbi:MAG: hypothetical protein HYY04_18920 [Chloroflexi bacterium]|nr:hypothetical protein [Chloroflexota bacterium]